MCSMYSYCNPNAHNIYKLRIRNYLKIGMWEWAARWKCFFASCQTVFFYNYKYEQSYKNISSNRNTTLSITISRLIPQYRKLDFRNKILFYQIIHQNDEPKSDVWFYNILEDFNFGNLLKIDISNEFVEQFFYFWNNKWLEMSLKCNLIWNKVHFQKKKI